MDRDINKKTDSTAPDAWLHDVFAASEKQNDVNVGELHIPEKIQKEQETKVDFSSRWSAIIKEDVQLHYWRWFLKLVTTTWIAVLGWIIVFLLYQYMYISTQPVIDPVFKPYVEMIHRATKTIWWYMGGNTYKQLSSLSLAGPDGKINMTSILSSTLSFLDKKYIMQNNLMRMIASYKENLWLIENTQRDIAQYGYLPQAIVSIFQNNNMQVSLQRWLVALEVIKFTTAVKVFSLLDTFVSWFADYIGESPSYVKEQMQKISDQGEDDIYAFLSQCYMNPYELSNDCDTVWDFDRRYAQQNSGTDMIFFKQLLYYVDQKLEQTDVPSFTIVFQKFDPQTQTISFSIEINTFQQDETALMQEGILNPHIFIVTNVIHLLKQSKFIEWSAIDAKQINIQQKKVKIGSNQFVVNHSLLQYTVPIQQDVSREIGDFEVQP